MKASELREKTAEELQAMLLDELRAGFSLRMRKGTGQLDKPSEIRKTRRNIARINTVMNEKKSAGKKGMNTEQAKAKSVTGTVISNKMDKTISVLVERTVKHPLYGKFVRRSTKLMAHDESNECNEGDTVVIEASRPISKNKAWRLQKVISKAQMV